MMQVHQHVDEGDEQHAALDDRIVAREDRADQQAAQTGQREHRLHHRDAAEQIAEHEADQRPGRRKGVGQDVAREHDVLRTGPWRGHAPRSRAAAPRAWRRAPCGSARRISTSTSVSTGIMQVDEARLEIDRDRHVADDRQPAEMQAEKQQQQQAHPEAGTDISKVAVATRPRSSALFWRHAASMPAGTAITPRSSPPYHHGGGDGETLEQQRQHRRVDLDRVCRDRR